MQTMNKFLFISILLIDSSYNTVNGLPVSKEFSGLTKPYENLELTEGDMRFPTPTDRGVARRGASVPWTDGIIPYEISTTGFGSTERSFIVATMQKMERLISMNNHKCIQFRPKNASDIYYITIINGYGCYSYVGQNTGISMVREVSLQHPGCLYEAIIMHELLHTLGFFHEQSRPDRDSYVRVNYANIWPGYGSNFDKYNNTVVDTLNTPYDYTSVMHYEPGAFSSNGLPTIEPLQAGAKIGQRRNMSTIDIEEVRILYNCSASGQTLPPISTTTTANIYQYNVTISSTLTSTNPVFTRPLGASFYYYDQYLLNVRSNGHYLIRSSSPIDTYGYLNTDPFDSTYPGYNLVAFDDDAEGSGQFRLEVYLESNTTYVLIVTTYNSYVTGSYSITASGYDQINITNMTSIPATTFAPLTTSSPGQTSTYSSALTTNSPRYDRTGRSLYNYYYESIQINASVNGYYSIRSVSSVDTYGYLYASSFDPLNPTVNLVGLNDDGAGNAQFLISYNLQTNTRYILVFTTYSAFVTASFSVVATGPGQVYFNLINSQTTLTTRTNTVITSPPISTGILNFSKQRNLVICVLTSLLLILV